MKIDYAERSNSFCCIDLFADIFFASLYKAPNCEIDIAAR